MLSLPWELKLAGDLTLQVGVVDEVCSTGKPHWEFNQVKLSPNELFCPEGPKGDSLEIIAEMDVGRAEQLALKLRCSTDGEEEAVIVFDTSDENRPLITGTRPTTNTIIHNTGKALGLTWEPVPQISIPGRGPRDLYTDGGDWMTTNEGRRLLTTTMLYENGGGHDPKVIRAVHDALADNFGITEVIALTPLDSRAVGYVMGNGHVDLQVRALPGGKVIVANVPAGDPQRPILEGNVRKLIEAGVPESKIIRVDNAAEGDGTKFFKTYTNALFLNKTVLIPMYGDTEADAAALAAYEQALNGSLPAQDKTRYRIVQVDGAESIQYSGVAHCAGRELPKTPRSPAGEMLASFRGTSMSFDAATGILSFTVGAIDFLGDAAEDVSSPAGNLDPLMGATIVAADLKLDPAMSSSDQFAFVGGNVTVRADGRDLFTASLPVLTVHGRWPSGSLDLCGALADIRLPAGDTSAWLVDFQRDVLGAPSGAPQFYVSSSTDLIDLSGEFTRSVGPVELDAMGICGSAPLLSPAAMSR